MTSYANKHQELSGYCDLTHPQNEVTETDQAISAWKNHQIENLKHTFKGKSMSLKKTQRNVWDSNRET
jgi:hypothetical protein